MDSLNAGTMSTSDAIRQTARDFRTKAEAADGWKPTSNVLRDSFESIKGNPLATADEKEYAGLALQLEKHICNPEQKSKAMYKALDILITPLCSPVAVVLSSMIDAMGVEADGWKNTDALLRDGLSYIEKHPQTKESGKAIAAITLESIDGIRDSHHCGTILYAALDAVKNTIPGPIGNTIAYGMYPIAQKADGWDDTDKVLKSSLSAIKEHQQTTEIEKTISEMALESVSEIKDSQHRGVVLYVAMDALKSAVSGPLGVVLAGNLHRMGQKADGWDDTDMVLRSGLTTIVKNEHTTETEKALAQYALDFSKNLKSSENRAQAMYEFTAALESGSAGPSGLIVAKAINNTAAKADGWKDTYKVLESGLQLIADNSHVYDFEKDTAKASLNLMKGSGSWEEKSQRGYDALKKIFDFYETVESRREKVTQEVTAMADNVAKPSDTHSVEVDDDMVVIGDVKLEVKKSRPLFPTA